VGQVRLVGRWFVIACGGVRRREDESTGAGQSGRVEHAQGLGDVHLERPQWIADGVGDSGPRREMDDRIDPDDGPGNGRSICQRGVDQFVGHAREIRAPADRQVVENPDPIAPFDEQPDER
jgi:hypothetical protein